MQEKAHELYSGLSLHDAILSVFRFLKSVSQCACVLWEVCIHQYRGQKGSEASDSPEDGCEIHLMEYGEVHTSPLQEKYISRVSPASTLTQLGLFRSADPT